MRTKIKPRPRPIGPEISPEAHSLEAQQVHAQIEQLVQRIQTGKQKTLQALRKGVGAPNETDRARSIWAGIVSFANAPLSDSPNSEAGEVLRMTNALCVHGDQNWEDMQSEMLGLGIYRDVYQLSRAKTLATEISFEELVRRLHPSFRNMLAWIADPNRVSSQERGDALELLLQHGEQALTQYDYDSNDEFDPTGNDGYPLYFWKRPQAIESIIGPVAHFLYERLEQYHDGALPLEEAVPILRCRREGCGKFAVNKRRTKDFCSDSCRTLHRQRQNPDAHAAYMRQYRKENYTK